jgi:hypothetical protein
MMTAAVLPRRRYRPLEAFDARQCQRCQHFWTSNAGPDRNFTVITRFCPSCIDALAAPLGWGLLR